MSPPTALVNLPRELQLMILQRALPYDFESLALTCKELYASSLPLLSQHNALRRKYRRFHFTNSYDHPTATDTTETVTELLLDIASDPIIAQYIVHADFGDRVCTDSIREGSHVDRGVVLERLEKEQENLRMLVQGSHHLSMLGVDTDTWFNSIVEDKNEFDEEVDFPLVFLLSLLPNIESLALPHEWRFSSVMKPPQGWDPISDTQRGVQDLIQLLVTRANDTESIPGNQPLRRLHSLRPTKDVDTQFGTNMASIAPFLALDSLREVHHDHGVLNEVVLIPKKRGSGRLSVPVLEFQAQGKYPVLGRNLETAVFEDVVISGDASQALFKDMHNLKRLEIQYIMKDEIGYDWDPETVLYNLMNNVGKSLESLSLTARDLGPDYGRIFGPNADVEDLHGFEALTHLELDTKLFIHSASILGNFDGEPTDEDEIEVPSLIDIAPPNLKTFSLLVPATLEDYLVLEGLLTDLDDRCGELPDLESIKVVVERRDVWNDDLDDWREHFEKVKTSCGEKKMKVKVLISQ